MKTIKCFQSMLPIFGTCILLICSSARAEAPLAGSRYVAMGSSYAAGPGVGTYDASSAGCMRSLNNYARLLASKRHLVLVDVSCSGATTANILNQSQAGFSPQINVITPDTKLVTITIGGNDVHYVGNLMGRSCRNEMLIKKITNTPKKCSILPNTQVMQKLEGIPEKLSSIVTEIRKRSPNAKIVFVNYLPALPNSGTCSNVPLTTEDSNEMRLTYQRLVSLTKLVATETHSILISSAKLGQGHDACSNQPYIAGYHPSTTPGWSSPAPYHPTQAGMSAIADEIDKVLSQ